MHASQAANKMKGENKVLERTNEKDILSKGLAALLCAARVNEGERSEVLSCHGGDSTVPQVGDRTQKDTRSPGLLPCAINSDVFATCTIFFQGHAADVRCVADAGLPSVLLHTHTPHADIP